MGTAKTENIIRIQRNARPFYVRREGETLRAVATYSPWAAPAAWTTPAPRIVKIDTAERALTLVLFGLFLAWPAAGEEKTRRRVLTQIEANCALNTGVRLPPGGAFSRRARLSAIGKMEELSAHRVETATAYWRGLWLAAGGGPLIGAMLGRRWGVRLAYAGPAGVKGIARMRARAAGLAKSTAKTLAAREWRAGLPVLHLAVTVGEVGGLSALARSGDAAALAGILDEAEKTRRLLPAIVPPAAGVQVEDMIQFRPAGAE